MIVTLKLCGRLFIGQRQSYGIMIIPDIVHTYMLQYAYNMMMMIYIYICIVYIYIYVQYIYIYSICVCVGVCTIYYIYMIYIYYIYHIYLYILFIYVDTTEQYIILIVYGNLQITLFRCPDCKLNLWLRKNGTVLLKNIDSGILGSP